VRARARERDGERDERGTVRGDAAVARVLFSLLSLFPSLAEFFSARPAHFRETSRFYRRLINKLARLPANLLLRAAMHSVIHVTATISNRISNERIVVHRTKIRFAGAFVRLSAIYGKYSRKRHVRLEFTADGILAWRDSPCRSPLLSEKSRLICHTCRRSSAFSLARESFGELPRTRINDKRDGKETIGDTETEERSRYIILPSLDHPQGRAGNQ